MTSPEPTLIGLPAPLLGHGWRSGQIEGNGAKGNEVSAVLAESVEPDAAYEICA
jgi:hypothetical protein